MNALLPELAEQLSARAEALARPRRFWQAHLRGLAVLLVALTSVGGVAYASRGLWQPQLGNNVHGHATASDSALPQVQLDHFSILRREQTEADRGYESQYALKYQGHYARGVRTNAVRLLSKGPGGQSAVLIPMERFRHPDLQESDALCIWIRDPEEAGGYTCAGTDTVLKRGLQLSRFPIPKQTPAQRRAEAAAVRASTAKAHRKGIRSGIRIEVPDWARGTQQPGHAVGLVPDGVAEVRFAARAGYPALSFPVRQNIYEAKGYEQQIAGTPKWFDADGNEVRFPILEGTGFQVPIPWDLRKRWERRAERYERRAERYERRAERYARRAAVLERQSLARP